jgi:hypothetical protein
VAAAVVAVVVVVPVPVTTMPSLPLRGKGGIKPTTMATTGTAEAPLMAEAAPEAAANNNRGPISTKPTFFPFSLLRQRRLRRRLLITAVALVVVVAAIVAGGVVVVAAAYPVLPALHPRQRLEVCSIPFKRPFICSLERAILDIRSARILLLS